MQIKCPRCKSTNATPNEAKTSAHCINCDKYFPIGRRYRRPASETQVWAVTGIIARELKIGRREAQALLEGALKRMHVIELIVETAKILQKKVKS